MSRKNSGNIWKWRAQPGWRKGFLCYFSTCCQGWYEESGSGCLLTQIPVLSLDQAQHHSFIIRRSRPFFIPAVGAYSKSHSGSPVYHCHWDVAFSPALWFSNPDCTLEAPVSFYKLPISWPLLRYSDLSGLGVARALGFLESSLVISKLQLKLRTTGLVKFGRRKKTICEVLS